MSEGGHNIGGAPTGAQKVVRSAAIIVKVRAGRMEARAMAAMIISAIWGAFWLTSLAAALRQSSEHQTANPTAEIAVRAVMAAAGIYCALLCLWAMFGHDRIVMRRGRLLLGNPWLLGALTRRYDLARVGSFRTGNKDCGAKHDGCCCSYSTVDYSLAFDYGGKLVPFFQHLPREAKDALRDRLNAALDIARRAGNDGGNH